MTAELFALLVAGFTHLLHIGVVAGFVYRTRQDIDWGASPRDIPREPGLHEARARRAEANHLTSLVLFAVAVLVLGQTGQFTGWTAALSWVVVVLRLVYIPAYILGWVPWRSAVWNLATLAIALLYLAALV